MTLQAPASLRRSTPAAPDADFDTLRATALAAIQRSQAERAAPWTDHNPHDPGITLLEAALHAIADLHYRVAVRGIDAWEAEASDWRGQPPPSGVDHRRALQRVLAMPAARDQAQALVDGATSLAGAAAWIANGVGDPDGTPLAAPVAHAVARALREPLLRRAALDRSGAIDKAVADGTPVAEAVAGLGLWPEELEALATRTRRRRLARLLRDAGPDLQRLIEAAPDAAAALAALHGPFEEPGDTWLGLEDLAERRVALAVHPCPPVDPELWEDERGETTLWPPHPLQARTVEPVTSADYRRLALAAPAVRRAFVVSGRAAGIDWKGEPTGAPRPFRRGALTLVVERAGLEPPRWDAQLTGEQHSWLAATLGTALGADSGGADPDTPYPDFRALLDDSELDAQAPRRLLGDEVGAAYMRSFGVVVRAVVEVEPDGLLSAVREDALARLRAFLSSDRSSPLEPAAPAPEPLRCPEDLDGPWPPPNAVAALRADPAGEVAARGWRPGAPVRASEVAQLLHAIPGVSGITGLALRREDQPATVWQTTLAAPAGHERYCVPAFAETPDCLVVRLRSQEECPGG